MDAVSKSNQILDENQNHIAPIIFSSEFLEFTSKRMDVAKVVINFAMDSVARVHNLEPIGYTVQNHYIAYFTKQLKQQPDKFKLAILNKTFTSAIKMLRLFLSDKRGSIIELK
ncbi:MAG: hypothetical protein ACW98K_10730 [Candidatus Kariarchaeaceae archaeon]|jgi:hypothetical protein